MIEKEGKKGGKRVKEGKDEDGDGDGWGRRGIQLLLFMCAKFGLSTGQRTQFSMFCKDMPGWRTVAPSSGDACSRDDSTRSPSRSVSGSLSLLSDRE